MVPFRETRRELFDFTRWKRRCNTVNQENSTEDFTRFCKRYIFHVFFFTKGFKTYDEKLFYETKLNYYFFL